MVGELSLSNSLSEKKLIQDQDLENYRQKAAIESKACSQHISKIENHLIEAKRQKERQEKLNAIKQKEYEAELKRQQFRRQQEQAERLRRQRIETQRQKEIKNSNDSVILD